ncbi:MAG: alpha/beta hydrolase [Frondihabitans sp.]|nr:alpha/beta hydrolase [Frondihabitans sp.]
MNDAAVRFARTPTLNIAYETVNSDEQQTVILLHGFPYDVRAFDDVVPMLATQGLRVVVPYLRGFGPTRFVNESAIRSGQQAALAQDLIDLMDALGIQQAVVAGYDWGGRAACIAAALFPHRVDGLVSVDGYNIQNIATSAEPAPPQEEAALWYQYYFHTERGRLGLERNRDDLCELLWRTWSPTWRAAATEFAASRPSLHNPDFVDVVIHSYRHRYGAVAGDPQYDDLEARIRAQPSIAVPTIVLDGLADGIVGGSANDDAALFTGPYEYRALEGVGHNTPQEAPTLFGQAALDVLTLR